MYTHVAVPEKYLLICLKGTDEEVRNKLEKYSCLPESADHCCDANNKVTAT